MSNPPEPKLSRAESKNLSALADGTLDPAERERVQAWVDADPARRERYERERQAVAHLRAAQTQDRAPERLRARIAAGRDAGRATGRLRPGLGQLSVAGGALAAATTAVVIGLTAGGGTQIPAPINQAAALAVRGPAGPTPVADAQKPSARLNVDVQDVYFPNWSIRFGWRAIGQRTDRVGRQPATTVYYARGNQQVAYTIMASPPLPQPSGQPMVLNRYQLYTFSAGGRTVVTWRRHGHTCVLSATAISASELQRLAAWDPAPVNV